MRLETEKAKIAIDTTEMEKEYLKDFERIKFLYEKKKNGSHQSK